MAILLNLHLPWYLLFIVCVIPGWKSHHLLLAYWAANVQMSLPWLHTVPVDLKKKNTHIGFR